MHKKRAGAVKSSKKDALRDGEERYRQIFEEAMEGIFQSTPEGTFLNMNPAFARMYGYDSPEQMKREVTDIAAQLYADPADRDEIKRLLTEDGFIKEKEIRYKCRDGSTLWVMANAHAIRGSSGEVLYYQGTTIDITKRKNAEKALRDSELRYRSLFESSLDGIVVIGLEGKIVEANQAYLDMLGYTLQEARELTYAQLTPEKWHEMEMNIVHEQILTRGYSDEYEKEDIRKDGTLVPISVRRWLIADESGSPIGMWNITRDITERKRAEDELRKANAELEGFAHTVSHDLKGPLSSIALGRETLQELLKGPQSDGTREGVEEVLRSIDRNVEKSVNLIEDLLVLAQAGQVPDEVRLIDVRKVVAQVLSERAASIEERGMRVDVAPDLKEVNASQTHIYQLFSNLIGNAIKHNDSESPRVEIAYLGDDEGGGRRYLVRDNGSGIPADDLEKVFIPFFRGKSGETGIGLSTVEKIVKLYGGDIKAYNDGGACFEFSIPDM